MRTGSDSVSKQPEPEVDVMEQQIMGDDGRIYRVAVGQDALKRQAAARKKTPAAKKSPAKKAPAKKTPAKKTPAKKAPAKKSPASRKRPGGKRPPKNPGGGSGQMKGVATNALGLLAYETAAQLPS